MPQAAAVADAKFERQAVFRSRSERERQQIPAIGEDRGVAHVFLDVIEAALARPRLQTGDQIAAVIFEREAAIEPLAPRHRTALAHALSPSVVSLSSISSG